MKFFRVTYCLTSLLPLWCVLIIPMQDVLAFELLLRLFLSNESCCLLMSCSIFSIPRAAKSDAFLRFFGKPRAVFMSMPCTLSMHLTDL